MQMIMHTNFKKLAIIVFWLANGKEMLNELHDIMSEVWVWWMQPIYSFIGDLWYKCCITKCIYVRTYV